MPALVTIGDVSASDEPHLRPASSRRISVRAFVELVLHLTVRQLKSTHHLTLLGWAWPVARQLAQLAVLVFVFSAIFDLQVENYPVFVFVGLVAWTWFSAGVSAAATAVLAQRHLVMQPRLPVSVLPVVAVVVPLVDVLFALPVLVVMLAISTGVGWGLVVCVVLVVVQLVLMVGLGWLTAAVSVFFRDVPNLVTVALLMLFYLTPVFYGTRTIPERYRWVLELNPMATIIETYRALLVGQPLPSAAAMIGAGLASAAFAIAGYLVFRRLQPRMADYL